jgi:hypothetical protein
MVEDAVDVVEVFPDELTDASIGWDSGVAVRHFITSGWSLDGTVIDKWVGNMRDLGFQDEGDIIMKNGHSISPALRETSEMHSSNRGLNSGEIMRGDVKRAVVIAYKEIQHRVARSTSHAFNKLISEGGDTRVADGDSIEWLEIMDKSKGAIFLLHTEPVGAVGCIRTLIYPSCKFVLENLDDVI